jgi:hypothetical protein
MPRAARALGAAACAAAACAAQHAQPRTTADPCAAASPRRRWREDKIIDQVLDADPQLEAFHPLLALKYDADAQHHGRLLEFLHHVPRARLAPLRADLERISHAEVHHVVRKKARNLVISITFCGAAV